MTTITVEAIYANGVLKPAQPLPLGEHEEVELVIRSSKKTQMDSQHDWMSVQGIAPRLLEGVDAQEWVSKSRQDDDAGRGIVVLHELEL